MLAPDEGANKNAQIGHVIPDSANQSRETEHVTDWPGDGLWLTDW